MLLQSAADASSRAAVAASAAAAAVAVTKAAAARAATKAAVAHRTALRSKKQAKAKGPVKKASPNTIGSGKEGSGVISAEDLEGVSQIEQQLLKGIPANDPSPHYMGHVIAATLQARNHVTASSVLIPILLDPLSSLSSLRGLWCNCATESLI